MTHPRKKRPTPFAPLLSTLLKKKKDFIMPSQRYLMKKNHGTLPPSPGCLFYFCLYSSLIPGCLPQRTSCPCSRISPRALTASSWPWSWASLRATMPMPMKRGMPGARPRCPSAWMTAAACPYGIPQGFMQRDFFDPDATVHVYESPTTLFVLLPHEARHAGFDAVLSMLLCSSRNCLPVSQTISGQVPDTLPGLEAVPWKARWDELRRVPPVLSKAAPSRSRAALCRRRGWGRRPEPRHGPRSGSAGRPAGCRQRKAPAAPGRFRPGADAPSMPTAPWRYRGSAWRLPWAYWRACCSTPCPACCRC